MIQTRRVRYRPEGPDFIVTVHSSRQKLQILREKPWEKRKLKLLSIKKKKKKKKGVFNYGDEFETFEYRLKTHTPSHTTTHPHTP